MVQTRQRNTTARGSRFSESMIEAVWRKARVVAGNDPDVFRKDACGAWIRRQSYGETTEYGWEIDHIMPVALGGGDEFTNLQPLQWENNRYKSDTWPSAQYCVVNG
jgi:5-methylcytosine-specific restriction endonuclease McrA